jgi:rod shape-determining protein MreC
VTLPRRARELVIVAVLLALPVLLLRASLRDPSKLSVVDRGLLRAAAPLQNGLASVFGGIANTWRRYVALWHVSDENVKLRDDNARLRAEVERLQHEAAHVAELEDLIKLRKEVKAETVSARIIGAETSSFFRIVRVRLDRGDLEIKPGMPVLAAAGVVGRVERVFGPYSDVVLASDPKSAIDVVVPRTGGRGVLKGMPGAPGRYRARIDYLLRQDEVAENDTVVTSGIGGFPRNLPVGKVVKVAKRDFGLYQEAEVEPAVEFGKLREVLIVVAPPMQEKAESP